METTIETFLWLGRETCLDDKSVPCNIVNEVENCVDENSYLLENKGKTEVSDWIYPKSAFSVKDFHRHLIYKAAFQKELKLNWDFDAAIMREKKCEKYY